MRSIYHCNCDIHKFATPWSDMLHHIDDESHILHLWYKLEDLRNMIEHRTSMLGKLRRTEESIHLLDLISMTEDERGLFEQFAQVAMADVYDVLFAFSPKVRMGYWWNEEIRTIVIDSTSSNVVSYKQGDYVEYDGVLHMAIEDGDSTDVDGKLVEADDYRESIHYAIVCGCGANLNMVSPLDMSIQEALVARIIYKWLMYAYPDEAPTYLLEYNEAKEQIRKRSSSLRNQNVVNRIPRIL